MRSTRRAATVACVVIMSAVIPCYARVDSEYIRWSGGEFEMPPSLKQVQDRLQLEPFLRSSDEFLRMAAVRRLGEIEGPKAAALLRDIAAKEPSPKGPDYMPLVKLEVVRVLDKTPGPAAEAVLIDLFNDCWSRRSDVQRDIVLRMCDFQPMGLILLDALDRRAASKAVLNVVQKVALSSEVAERGILPDRFRQRVWEVYLKAKMIDSGAVTEVDQVEGLLNELTAVERQWPFGYLSLGHIKVLAIRRAIARYNQTVLRAVAARVDNLIRTESFENAVDPQNRRRELAKNRDYVRMLVRDRQVGSRQSKRMP